MDSLRTVVASVGLMILSLSSVAFSMGHGEPLNLGHFTKQPTLFWAGIVLSQDLPEERFGAFEMGEGRSLVVTKTQPPGALLGGNLVWRPGQVLAFSEEAIPGKTPLIGKEKGLYFLDTREYVTLNSNPGRFVTALSPTLKKVTLQEAPSALFQESSAFNSGNPASVDMNRLMNDVKWLSGEIPARVGGREALVPERGTDQNRKLARELLVAAFQDEGVESQLKCYTSGWFWSNRGCNVEATLWGRDRSRMIVFSSHLDSVRNKGADDNASGTAALLEIARLLKSRSLDVSVRFLAFDQEEIGLVGSKAYVESLGSTGPQISAVFNMDMISYDGDGDFGYHLMDCDRQDSAPLADVVERTAADLGLSLTRVKGCTNRSDHASFWQAGIPAVLVSENFFGGDSNPCYHKQCDTVSHINREYYQQIVTLMANVGLAAAGEVDSNFEAYSNRNR